MNKILSHAIQIANCMINETIISRENLYSTFYATKSEQFFNKFKLKCEQKMIYMMSVCDEE